MLPIQTCIWNLIEQLPPELQTSVTQSQQNWCTVFRQQRFKQQRFKTNPCILSLRAKLSMHLSCKSPLGLSHTHTCPTTSLSENTKTKQNMEIWIKRQGHSNVHHVYSDAFQSLSDFEIISQNKYIFFLNPLSKSTLCRLYNICIYDL